MTEIDPYIRVLLLREVGDLSLPGGHCRKHEMVPHLVKHLRDVLKKYGTPDTITNVEELGRRFIHRNDQVRSSKRN